MFDEINQESQHILENSQGGWIMRGSIGHVVTVIPIINSWCAFGLLFSITTRGSATTTQGTAGTVIVCITHIFYS